MKFLVDAQLPPATVRWLRERGHEAQAVRELGLRDAEDAAIWTHAFQTDAAILTKDEDFAGKAQRTPHGPVIIWLRVGNCSNHALRAWLEPRLSGIEQLVAQGSRLVEVL